MEISTIPSLNPIEHARNIEDILSSLKSLCRSEIHVFHDPKGKALLETSAEVLGGLEKAFHDYLSKDMDVWKEEHEETRPQRSIDPWD
jgi:hypothetical protein